MKKFLIIILIFFGYALSASAAELSLVAPSSIKKGQQFILDVQLDTSSTSINSVDIGISYPKDIVEFRGYQEHGGVVNIWLNSPKDESGIIKFSGIIPGGVEGSYSPNKSKVGPVSLAKLIFVATANGNSKFYINSSKILVNDGYGSPLIYSTKDTNIDVYSDGNEDSIKIEKNTDKELPEPFDITLVASDYFSRTPTMIIFNTTDKISGIKKYEMNDGNDSSWITVNSPLPIQRGLFSKEITIRAVDFNDNNRESKIKITGILSNASSIILVLLILIFAYSRFLWYKKKR